MPPKKQKPPKTSTEDKFTRPYNNLVNSDIGKTVYLTATHLLQNIEDEDCSDGDEGAFESQKNNSKEEDSEDEDTIGEDEGDSENNMTENFIFPVLDAKSTPENMRKCQPPTKTQSTIGFLIISKESQTTEDDLEQCEQILYPFALNQFKHQTIFSSPPFSMTNMPTQAKEIDLTSLQKLVTERNVAFQNFPKGIKAAYCGQLQRMPTGKKGSAPLQWIKHGFGFMHFQDGSTLYAKWEHDNASTPSFYISADGLISKTVPSKLHAHSREWLESQKKAKTQPNTTKKIKRASQEETTEEEHAFTTEIDEDGDIIFAGYTKGGIRDGFGVAVMPDGAVMIGCWNQGDFSGPGKCSTSVNLFFSPHSI